MGGCGGGCGCHNCGPVQPAPWFRQTGVMSAFAPVGFGRPQKSPQRGAGCKSGTCAAPVRGALPAPLATRHEDDHHHVGELVKDDPAVRPNPDDEWAQEPADFDWSGYYGANGTHPVGVLPGGLTQAEWGAMTPAERTAYIQTNARTDAQRAALLTESIRQGIDGMQTILLAIYAAENLRRTSEADRVAARQAQDHALEIARIEGETARAIAVANANRPIIQQNPLSTPNPDPNNAPMPTSTKVAIGGAVTAGAIGLGLLIWKVAS